MSPQTSQDVQASVQFLTWQDMYNREKPFNLFFDISPDAKDQRKTNLVFEDVDIQINDMRGSEESFDLDTHGFMVTQLPPFAIRLENGPVEEFYLPAVEKLLKEKVEGADRVLIYDWRVRLTDDESQSESINIKDFSAPLKPTNTAHIAVSAVKRLQMELGTEAADAAISRARIINVWRPVYHTVEDLPLALCDGRSIDESALVETDVVRAAGQSSNLFAMHRTCNHWYYLSQQKPEEGLIFKQFDTKPDVQSKYCVHTSFKSPIAAPDTPSRQSIEVRAIVLTYA